MQNRKIGRIISESAKKSWGIAESVKTSPNSVIMKSISDSFSKWINVLAACCHFEWVNLEVEFQKGPPLD